MTWHRLVIALSIPQELGMQGADPGSAGTSFIFPSSVKLSLFLLVYCQALNLPGFLGVLGVFPPHGMNSPARMGPRGSGSANPRLERAKVGRRRKRRKEKSKRPARDNLEFNFPRALSGHLISPKSLRFPLGPPSLLLPALVPAGSLPVPAWSPGKRRHGQTDRQTVLNPGMFGGKRGKGRTAAENP